MTEEALADLERLDLVARIWARDHTAWKPDPTEIADRLGWLDVVQRHAGTGGRPPGLRRGGAQRGRQARRAAGHGRQQPGAGGVAPDVRERARLPQAHRAGLHGAGRSGGRHAPNRPGRDPVLPSRRSPAQPRSHSRSNAHFRALVEGAVGAEAAGRHFFAITDAGTPLEVMAREQGFRCAFLNPTDIGGRYSVLSYFGLAPAALTGLDVATLLQRAAGMMDCCGPSVPVRENPAALLGAAIGGHATLGRNKLTLVASPSIAGFGLWAEQLIAESTGKEGRGIVPVAGEPLLEPGSYGDDRLFV